MLVNCVVYQQGTKLKDIAVEDISDYVAQPDCFVWVALRDASAEELSQMQEEFGLHDLAVEDARNGNQRPKIEDYDGSLFTVMPLLEHEEDGYHMGALNIFVGANYVLSVRNSSPHAFLGVRTRCESEPELLKSGPGFVLYALMDAVVDRYFPLVEHLENDLEILEEQVFADKANPRENIERLYAIKRRTVILKHVVAPMMDAMGRLHGARVPKVCSSSQDYFRDVHDHLIRINTSLEALRENISTATQVNLSLVAIEHGEVNKRLAAWAGIFAMATAFVGVWGMNFKYMPELDMPWGYPAALALISGICGFLYFRFKRAGWL